MLLEQESQGGWLIRVDIDRIDRAKRFVSGDVGADDV
jgi:hypothetical protein